jgi:hypothetical protein
MKGIRDVIDDSETHIFIFNIQNDQRVGIKEDKAKWEEVTTSKIQSPSRGNAKNINCIDTTLITN